MREPVGTHEAIRELHRASPGPLLDNDRRRIELMNGMLMSLPGTPIIYYLHEIGMGDNIYLGDRNGVRTSICSGANLCGIKLIPPGGVSDSDRSPVARVSQRTMPE